MHYAKRLLFTIIVLIISVILCANNSKKIIINEFLASNSTILQDEDNDYSDWIELYNPGNSAVNLQGWRLTDSDSKPAKWIFPVVSIPAKQYLVVFASGKNRTNPNSELHTNFSLSKDGEYLAIIEPDGTISDAYTPVFPPQKTDISYGYYEGQHVFFEIPTPGAANTIENKIQPPVFSVERGFFDEPFSVSLTVSDPDTKIYYTTDGTRPTEQNTLYTGPVDITQTTPLRAVGIKNGVPGTVVTNTYFFVEDIVNQPNNPTGYPDRWGYLGSDIRYDDYAVGERAPADYAMDPNVCNHPFYKNQIKEAFLSIPSVSIVTNLGYLFSDSTDENEGGIYIHTGVNLGDGWERPVSLEYYEPSTGRQFQINCGLRIHGAASRQPEKSGKHSFRTVFRKTYGEANLRFDLFEEETAVTKFDHLVFHAGYNLSWLHSESGQRKNTQYTNDSFGKRTQRDMGHLSSHDRFVHLFINGLYWGLYNISERINDKFMVSYFEGDELDYDVINHDGLADGDITAFNRMVDLAANGEFDQLLSEQLLYIENYIDYILLNFYIGNLDWSHNNWYAARGRIDPGNGFYFFSWDAENSLTDVNINRINGLQGKLRSIMFGSSSGSSTDGGLYHNDEFRLMFADRVHKHFFNGGSLTPEKTIELYEKIAAEIDLAVILESARWGDYRMNTLTPRNSNPPLYTRNDHWLPRKEKLLKEYFPRRTGIIYEQLESLGLVSEITPPVFSSYGENVDDFIELSMSTTDGLIYYTTDGTDPRERVTGNVTAGAIHYSAPLHITEACTIKARTKNGQLWSALSEAIFTGGNVLRTPIIPKDIQKVYCYDNSLYLVLEKPGNVRIEIYSTDGKCVQEVDTYVYKGNNQIRLSGVVPSGVYIYKVIFNGTLYNGKIIY